jgi:hypothetical protein
MKRTLMILVAAGSLGLASRALAADAAAKPDCAEKQKAYDDAKTATKATGKPICRAARTRRAKRRPTARSR